MSEFMFDIFGADITNGTKKPKCKINIYLCKSEYLTAIYFDV